jgi:hypothetical protein
MKINWLLKSKVFGVIDYFKVYRVLYFLQRYVTKRSDTTMERHVKDWIFHKTHCESIMEGFLLEFGGGKDLRQNLYLSQFVSQQVVVDLFPMLNIDLVNRAGNEQVKLGLLKEHFHIKTLGDLKKYYNIDYISPLDVSKSEFQDSLFDCCVSTNTMEHIPIDSIMSIMGELSRIVKKGGLISMIIDYSDHYSHTDDTISKLNFLQFSPHEWEKYNHECHYQNRLRHYDYENIFREFDFEILVNEPSYEISKPLLIADCFLKENDTVCATAGKFLLRVC